MSRQLRNRFGSVFLCYHSVAPEGPRYLTVTAELFERQLATLRRRRRRTGGREDLARAAVGEGRDHPVFITFDDGFVDNHETVLPLLRAYGARAFVFVLPPLVDTGAPLAWPEVAEWQREMPGTMRSVTWEMLGEMQEGGFEVGSHTLTHGHLSRLGPEELRDELSESRRRIVERMGSCDTLAYPFGEWNQAVVAAAAECGYRFAFTLPTGIGQRHAGPLTIPRVNVDYRDTDARFAAKLSTFGRRVLLSPRVHDIRGRRGRLAGMSRGRAGVAQ